jgi:hypothetical protein
VQVTGELCQIVKNEGNIDTVRTFTAWDLGAAAGGIRYLRRSRSLSNLEIASRELKASKHSIVS